MCLVILLTSNAFSMLLGSALKTQTTVTPFGEELVSIHAGAIPFHLPEPLCRPSSEQIWCRGFADSIVNFHAQDSSGYAWVHHFVFVDCCTHAVIRHCEILCQHSRQLFVRRALVDAVISIDAVNPIVAASVAGRFGVVSLPTLSRFKCPYI